jgi:hypothetical protein
MPAETLVVSTVLIDCSPEEVFAFGSTPQTWPTWHPTALSVSGATGRPVRAGDEIFEEDRFSFLRGNISWRVREATPSSGWVIDGVVGGVPLFGGTITSIRYTLTRVGASTRLERVMTYRVPNALARLLDLVYFRRHNVRQSQRAVERMKALLEEVDV